MLAISRTVIAQFGQTQLSMAVCAAIEFHVDKKQNPEGWKPLDARKRIVAEWTDHAPHAAASIDKACTYGRHLFGNVAFNARLVTEASAEGADNEDYGSTLIGLRHFVADELRKGGYGAGYDEVGRWASGKLPKVAEEAAIKAAHDKKVADDAAARSDAAAAAAARDEQAKHNQAAAEKITAKANPAPAPAPAGLVGPKEPIPAEREPAITVGLVAPVMLASYSRSAAGEYSLTLAEAISAEELESLIVALQSEAARMAPAEVTSAPEAPKAKRSRKATATATATA